MKKIFLIVMVVLCVGFIVYILKNKTTSNIKKRQVLVATVKAAPIKIKTLSKHIIAYGVAAPKPGKVKTVNLSFEAVMDKLFVIDGQNVKKGQVLFSVLPSSAAKLQLLQAENVFKLSKENLKLTKEKFKMHLLTSQDVLNAQNAFNHAKITYENLIKTYRNKVLAPVNGVVTKINYTEGSHITMGSSILEIANTNDFAIKCGVEPNDINYLKLNTPVSISFIDYDKKASGKIASISNIIDPFTHLINVYILPSSNEQLLLNSYAEVEIPILQYTGLTVPKEALLYDGGHYVIYTVKDGVAHKHIVNVVIKNQKYAQIAPCGISENELVVTQGAYELKDNMKVKVEK